MLPGSNYFAFSIAWLILIIYLEDPLFLKYTLVAAIFLGLFSAFPWYVFAGLVILWIALVKYIAAMMFAAKSIPSLILFYLVSYGLFDGLFLIARIIRDFFLKEPLGWTSLWSELKFAGIGLLAGATVIVIIYSIGNYFEKKFSSLFFIRRRL